MAYINDIRAIFILYCRALQVYQAAVAALEALGARPQFPAVVITDTDYTDVVADIEAYDADVAAAKVVVVNCFNALLASRTLLLTSDFVTNNWSELEAVSPGDFAPFADTVWIGMRTPSIPVGESQIYFKSFASYITALIVLEDEPACSFSDYIAANPVPEIPNDPISTPITPPGLTAAVGATVDAPFLLEFDPSDFLIPWSANIYDVKIGGVSLDAAAWKLFQDFGDNIFGITLTPAADALLQTSGTKAVTVLAYQFSNAAVSQAIAAGVATQLLITTQPTAPVTNGAVLAQQPVVRTADQYGNTKSGTPNVLAAAGVGTFTIGGTNPKAAVAGVATFTNLTASSAGAVSGAKILFSSAGLNDVLSSAFNIPAP